MSVPAAWRIGAPRDCVWIRACHVTRFYGDECWSMARGLVGASLQICVYSGPPVGCARPSC
jgi:hypothetical protein